jgi:signal transduction histidine kinase/DNA-binding response OmpR family regulator/streptogramin lyase
MFDKSNGKFRNFSITTTNPLGITEAAEPIIEDDAGILWISINCNLNWFNDETQKFIPCHNSDKKMIICSMYKDRSGVLWFGTMNEGVFRLNGKIKPFINVWDNDLSIKLAKNNLDKSVTSILKDSAGTLWIGKIDGLISIDDKTNAMKVFTPREGDPGSISGKSITQIIEASPNVLWIGTVNDGLNKLNKTTGQCIQYKHDPKNPGSLKANLINRIFLDDSNTLWVSYGEMLQKFNSKEGNFTTLYDTAYKPWINTIFQDKNSKIWLGFNGLASIDLQTSTFNYYVSDTAEMSRPFINQICEDKNSIFWIGTNDRLDKFDRRTGKFTHITTSDGLANDQVISLLEDDSNNLWLLTPAGITKYNTATGSIRNYDEDDGITISGGAIYNPTFKDKNGEVFFGSLNGLIRFYPDSIKDNLFIPPVVITSFKKFNKESKPDSSITLKKMIELPYNENNISFEFASLNYDSPQKNQYAYQLVGLDNDWVYSGTRRFASYPNLGAGEYIFRVKGSNNDGVWNEAGTSITIIISPPLWKTWWAYVLYTGFFIFTLYGIRRYEMNRISYKNQVKVDKAVLIEKEETEKIKSRFFANISHEFRTPLTLILGPAEKIISDTSDDIKKDANIIKRNSRRLLQLINQLLDLSKLESGKLKLEASKGNIVSFVKGVALSFESLAESKDITLKLLPEKDFIELYFDREKMMKILTNLLSNAFKFTPEEGMVTVSIKPSSFSPLSKGELKGGSVEIKIKDTGIGIPQEEIPKLFDRFYQVDSSFTKEHEGTGIGLALTKELVELHHGKIDVESKIGDPDKAVTGLPAGQASWTEFMVTLPLGSSHLKDDEIIKTEKTETSILPVEQEVYTSSLSKPTADSMALNINDGVIKDQLEEKTMILVVEDNYDMREYIKESIGDSYRVEEAVNGEQGVRKAEKIIPDLIISDMMMPKMDGNELTRILKNNEKTSHIPIILLTARSGQENKIEGLETGADDYLTKPFDIRELHARIENLIKIRRKLQAKYSKLEYVLKSDGKKGTSLDEKFIVKVMEVIDKHISEEEFSIEEFGGEVGMSRTQFHRKFKAITGKPASMFLRSIRLARAKKMIEEQHGNISEIAYSVGFSSPSYFTKCFREEFGYPPSNLIN